MADAPTGPILLEPSSLYVTTTQLAEAKFHWALIATDANCSAVRHHWHEKPDTRGLTTATDSRTSARARSSVVEGLSGATPCEAYGFQKVHPKSLLTGRVVLGYFKISGYCAPPPATFAEICQTTFGASYSTVHENRRNGITCRTWVLQVLSTLCARAYITGYEGTIQNFVDSLERVITEQSRLADNTYLTTFYTQRILTFVSSIMVI
ncbi:hypothetical protein B0H17DRAFT_144898 [Mycena rosella]|uniref:Uncharacterized protein n=1 Tax=Mycena rosella TaxID=1033263 RepID=A0AAD7DY03_MYCRO|nr:hypothetical protein B0H17DRAFT_144898 [Mycena rosella]